METIYPLVLYYILCFPGISAEALLIVHKRAATVYHAVRKGIANNHIAEYTLKHSRHVTKYLVLTAAGILYLQEKSTRLTLCSMLDRLNGYPSESWWSEEIFVNEDDALKFRVSGVSTEYMLRVCGISIANLFWNSAGASTAVTLLPETINSPYCEAIIEALTQLYMFDIPSPFQDGYELVYEDAFSVKSRLAKVAAPELARAGRYSGVLITEHIAYTVYHGPKDGMSWAPLARKRDLDAMDVYHDKLSPLKYVHGQKKHSIILIQNAKMFADLLLDVASRNKDRRGQIIYRLGEGYDSLVAFPVTFAGVQLAQRYISADPKTAVENLTRQIQKSFFPNARIMLPYSMAVDHNKNEIYQLAYMDVRHIFHLIKTCQDESFEILCLDWQVDYYERIVDFVKLKNSFELDGLQIIFAEVRVKPEIVGLFRFRPAFSESTYCRTPQKAKTAAGKDQLPDLKSVYYIPGETE